MVADRIESDPNIGNAIVAMFHIRSALRDMFNDAFIIELAHHHVEVILILDQYGVWEELVVGVARPVVTELVLKCWCC